MSGTQARVILSFVETPCNPYLGVAGDSGCIDGGQNGACLAALGTVTARPIV